MKKLAIILTLATLTLFASDGAALAKKCAGCHGADFR